MRHKFLVPLVCLALAALQLPARAEKLDDTFLKLDPAWRLDRRVESVPSLTVRDKQPGLAFTSKGLDTLTRDINLGDSPFEFRADLELTDGTLITFPRYNGVAIALSSAPADKFTKNDYVIIFAVHQHGATAMVARGGIFGARNVRENIWHSDTSDASPRFKTTHAGAGGTIQSLTWPNQALAGMKLRFHATVDKDRNVTFKIYNVDAGDSPWWDAQTEIPADLRATPLKHVIIRTMRNPEDFADLGRAYTINDAHQGRTITSGILQRVAVQALEPGAKPTLDQGFPPAVLPAKPKPADYRSMMLPPGQTLEKLRARFNSPAYADYRAILLRNAETDKRDGLSTALWAYVLTGDKKYRDNLLVSIDTLSAPVDTIAHEKWGYPGRLRQQLDIKEFAGHGAASLAFAYDLLGNDLDQPRRDRLRYLLVRSVKNFLNRIERNDWWYINNPSNTIAVGNGTMGICAVALRDDDPELSKTAYTIASDNIKKAFIAVRPDGGCIEGNLYWNYALSWQLVLGHALRNTTGNDHTLLTMPGIKNTHQYITVNFAGNNELIPFNDSQPWLTGYFIAAHAGAEFDQPLMRWFADHMAREFAKGETFGEQTGGMYAVLAFLYRDEKPAPAQFPGLPTLAHLESLHEAIMRSDGKTVMPTLVTAVKGKGQLSTHHANQDQGSFVLQANGESLLIDPGYFQDGPANHSLPVIGDVATMKLDPKVVCPITHKFEAGDLRSLRVDATPAYLTTAKRAARVFVQVADRATVILDDTIPSDPKQPITTHFQAGFKAEAANNTARITGNNGELAITLFGPDITLKASPVREFKNSWVYRKRGITWQTISGAYTYDNAKPLVTVLAPATAKRPAATAKVDYAAKTVTVTIDNTTVVFDHTADGWLLRQPKP